MSALEIRRLKAFGMQVHGDACRDLELLRAINVTLDSLDIELERASQLNHVAEQLIRLVKKSAEPISSETDLVALFDKARDTVGEAHAELEKRHQAAMQNLALTDDDDIVDGYSALLVATADLHNNLNALSWAVGEHNADFDKPVAGAFQSANDLFDAMGV